MKYFLIVGEASGDLHASNLMQAIAQQDPDADFTYMGGIRMRALGGRCVVPCEQISYMGFVDVVLHLRKISAVGKRIQKALCDCKPDVIICVDYAGFNFKYILPFAKRHLPTTPLVYYIPPKVWAWQEYRLRILRRHTHQVLCIFPFEIPYFTKHHLTQASYVGNPSLDAVKAFEEREHDRTPLIEEPYLALVCGSRQSEVRKNLPLMLNVAKRFPMLKAVVTATSAVDREVYLSIPGIEQATVVEDDTMHLIRHAKAALVTSGTATLETALLGTPQVVCYAIGGGRIANLIFDRLFRVPYISLVNLIAGKEVVQECFGAEFREERVAQALAPLVLPEGTERQSMLNEYARIRTTLATERGAAAEAARKIGKLLKRK